MDGYRTRREALAFAAGGIAVAGCLDAGNGDGVDEGSADGDSTDDGGASDSGADESGDDAGGDAGSDDVDWRTATLTDVTTEESFSIAAIDTPVVVHTFAIWCSTCSRQHEQIRELRERTGDNVAPVELNVDPNENAGAIREHAAENGYDWRFVVSPPAVTETLVDEFGSRMTSPPRSPVILVTDDETRVLDDSAVVSADTLESEIADV